MSKFTKISKIKKINMLRDKVTKNLSELQNNFSPNQLRSMNIFQTLKSLKLSAKFAEFKVKKKIEVL